MNSVYGLTPLPSCGLSSLVHWMWEWAPRTASSRQAWWKEGLCSSLPCLCPTIKNANVVAVLDQGRIIECGKHERAAFETRWDVQEINEQTEFYFSIKKQLLVWGFKASCATRNKAQTVWNLEIRLQSFEICLFSKVCKILLRWICSEDLFIQNFNNYNFLNGLEHWYYFQVCILS